jgi:hypothetical protein
MRLHKPLLFFVLAALLPFLGTVSAQQRPPQTIDDLFNPRPTAPVPQQQREPRPGDVQQEDLPPPPGARESTKETKAKAKKKRDDAAQPQQEPPLERSFKDIIAPPKGGEAARKGKALPDVPVPQRQEVKVENPTAIFSGLDKITGRIYPFEVSMKETVQFGALRVTPQACYTRPPTEPQNTTGFVEVDEITLEGKIRRVFTGWMFAASPGLHAVEHPIYDVWLVDCKQGPPDVAKSSG